MAVTLANALAAGDLKVRLVANACKWRHFQSTQDSQYGPFCALCCLSLLWMPLHSEKAFSEPKGQECLR